MSTPQRGRLDQHLVAPALPHTPWWLWCNILCLDAPVVALGWHLLSLRAAGVEPGFAPAAVLFMTVWSIYVVDHWLDSRGHGRLFARHLFMRGGGRPLVFLAAVFCAGCGALLPIVPRPVVRNGAVLLAFVLAYLFMAHLRKSSWPREIVVGTTFAAGALLTAFTLSSQRINIALQFGMLAGVAALNCILIEVREAADDRSLNWPARWVSLNGVEVGAVLAVSGIAVVALGHSGAGTRVFIAEIASALLLSIVSALRRRISADVFHVLADAALMTPYVGLLL